MDKSRLLLLHDILHEHVHASSVTTFVQVPVLAQVDCRHGSRVSLRIPILSRGVSSPSLRQSQLSGHTVLLRRKLKLTDCRVRDLAERVALSQCTAPPFLFLQVAGWPAQSLSVDTFTDCGNVMISIRHVAPETPFKFRVVRFTFISALEVGQRIFSCRFLHAVHDVCALLAHVQQLSHGCPGARLVCQSPARPATLSLVFF